MTMQKLSAAVALVALVAIASVAFAQSGLSFDALDTNKDGRISALEAKKDPRVAARFAAADTNQDGYLDRAEFGAIVG